MLSISVALSAIYYDNLINAFVKSLVGIVNVKLPAVTVCDPNVNVAIALSPWVLLYSKTASNAVARVTVVHANEALGVQNAVVPDDVGSVALVTVTPPAV